MKDCIEKLTVAEETSASLIQEIREAHEDLPVTYNSLDTKKLMHAAEQLSYEITALREKLETTEGRKEKA